jgi:hypothetical protein
VKLIENCWAAVAGLFMKVLSLTRRVLLSMLLDLLIKATYSSKKGSALVVVSWIMIVGVWPVLIGLGVLSYFLVFSEV